MGRLFFTAAALSVLMAGATATRPAAQPQSVGPLPHDLPRLREWIDAVDRHNPGERDVSAIGIGSWSRSQLEVLVLDLEALLQLIVNPDRPRFPRAARAFSPADVAQLKALADQQAQRAASRPVRSEDLTAAEARRAVNRLTKRGALLHTDIALLVSAPADRSPEPPATGQKPLLAIRSSVLVADGRQEGLAYTRVHWDVARVMLHGVMPQPSGDAAARRWYRGVAAFFESRRLLAESRPHLERARQLFPADPEIFAASGRLHETYAAPRIQNFIQASARSGELNAVIGSARSNLRQAETFFRRAVELDGSFAQARVHLGRVIGLEGRHEDAAHELERATETAGDSLTLYYAWLFRGAEEQTLGRSEQARESFGRAVALYPRAQSPRLALSQLARRNGDRQAAFRAIQQMLTLSADQDVRNDPWWTYLGGSGREAESLLDEARATLFLTREER